MLRLYNSLTRQTEAVETPDGEVKMFTCGPTVYKSQHIGNMRSFLLGDLIGRVLRSLSLGVRWIVNITDVGHPFGDDDWKEDKLQLEAEKRREAALVIARKFEKEFLDDWEAMNFQQSFAFPRASEHITEIIDLVEGLVTKGYGYVANEDVAFDVARFPKYGELSGHDPGELRSERAPEGSGRRSKNDFALWRGAGPNTAMEWPSPWGRGYPGWHIEDTAISFKWLGRDRVDVHTGGEDLKFPHHEAEVAQAEAITGQQYVRIWVHGGHVLTEGKKMAKSAGNVITLREVREAVTDPLALRYLFLTAHYRRQVNVTKESLKAAATALERLRMRRGELGESQSLDGEAGWQYHHDFMQALTDDLDTPTCVRVLHGMLADPQVSNPTKAWLLDRWDGILGLKIREQAGCVEHGERETEETEQAKLLLTRRAQARAQQHWDVADAIRGELDEMGWRVEDLAQGSIAVRVGAQGTLTVRVRQQDGTEAVTSEERPT